MSEEIKALRGRAFLLLRLIKIMNVIAQGYPYLYSSFPATIHTPSLIQTHKDPESGTCEASQEFAPTAFQFIHPPVAALPLSLVKWQ